MHFNLTPMQRAEYSAAMRDEVNRKIPLGRHATPEEIAGLSPIWLPMMLPLPRARVYDRRRGDGRWPGQPARWV